jgi:hypothetical protein
MLPGASFRVHNQATGLAGGDPRSANGDLQPVWDELRGHARTENCLGLPPAVVRHRYCLRSTSIWGSTKDSL